ncbi:MAG: asparagine synthase-related protein [Gemmatimonadota bacterium]
MSAFAGIWYGHGRAVDPAALERMAAALPGGSAAGIALLPGAGLATAPGPWSGWSNGPSSVGTAQPGEAWALSGRLAGAADSLPAALRTSGATLAAELRGDYALAVIADGRLLLARDLVGTRPLYWAELPGGVVFATTVRAVLAHGAVDRTPDDPALAELFLGTRTFPASVTFLKEVRALPPGHYLLAHERGLNIDRARAFQVPALQLDPAAAAISFRDRFVAAVARRLVGPAPVAVLLSGGIDSSAVYSVARMLHARDPARFPPAFGVYHGTADGSAADETAWLRVLEERWGEAVIRVPAEPGGFPAESMDEVLESEAPAVGFAPGPATRALTAAREHGAAIILSGGLGDQVLFPNPPAYLAELLRAGRLPTLARHLLEMPRWHADVPAAVLHRAALEELARQLLPGRLLRARRALLAPLRQRRKGSSLWGERLRAARLPHGTSPTPPDAAAPAGTGDRQAAAVRGISSHGAAVLEAVRLPFNTLRMEWGVKGCAAHGLTLLPPFADEDLLVFLAGLPGTAAAPQGVPRGILRDGLRGIVPDAILARRDKGNATGLFHAAMAGAAEPLARLLSHGAAVRAGYLDTAGLDAELARLHAASEIGRTRAAAPLLAALGLELWLRAFVTSDPLE